MHMAHMIDLMVYFPFIIVGLGQALILGTSPTGRVPAHAAKATARGTIHGRFGESRHTPGNRPHKKATVPFPRCPGTQLPAYLAFETAFQKPHGGFISACHHAGFIPQLPSPGATVTAQI
jgi:hypothetical protein